MLKLVQRNQAILYIKQVGGCVSILYNVKQKSCATNRIAHPEEN